MCANDSWTPFLVRGDSRRVTLFRLALQPTIDGDPRSDHRNVKKQLEPDEQDLRHQDKSAAKIEAPARRTWVSPAFGTGSVRRARHGWDMIRFMKSSKSGTVNAVSPWAGL